MKNRFLLIFLILASGFQFLLSQNADTTLNKVLTHQNRERTYTVHIPKNFTDSSSLPILIVLHGRFGKSTKMMDYSGFNKTADANGFIVVYPDGIKMSWADDRNATPASEMKIDDAGFVSMLIDAVVTGFHADPSRVYVAGMSNGGFMAFKLANELSNKIAAVAVIAATLPSPVPVIKSTRAVPVLLINGTEDPIIPYKGGVIFSKEGTPVISTDSVMNIFSKINNCKSCTQTDLPDTAPEDGTTVKKKTWTDCGSGNELVLYQIVNGGHTMPGKDQYLKENWIGIASQEFDSAQVIWDYLKNFNLKK